MRLKHVLPVLGAITVCGAGAALAAHPQVDPQTVPTGFLSAHTTVNNIPRAAIERSVRTRKFDVFIQHIRLAANEATPFHTHPGPAVVSIRAGTLRYEDAHGGRCRRKTYGPGQGFVDRGFGHVHRAVAGPQGADFYAVYLLPRRTGAHFTERPALRECAR
jgi:hypothetical protein